MKLVSRLILLSFFITACGKPDLKDIPKSDHFNGEVFVQEGSRPRKRSILKMLKWRLFERRAKWPAWLETKQQKPPYAKNQKGELSLSFINHATNLIQIDGFNILTDPVWSKRVSPLSFIGPKRHRAPGVKLKDLPKIDAILISHNHYDHMDVETLEKLAIRDQPKIFMGLGNSYYLKPKSKSLSIELDWNEFYDFYGLKIYFLPAKHWSKRTLSDTNKSLWGAFALKGSHNVYFGGDTGYGEHFKEAGKKFKDFDLALIPIGAYEPRWFMKTHHMNPQEAVEAHIDLKSKLSVGIHFGTFQLTDEAITAPQKALKESLKKLKNPKSFITLKEGESLIL